MLSKPFEILKKTPLVSVVGLKSKLWQISWTIDSSWATQESPGIKPDWHCVKSLFCLK